MKYTLVALILGMLLALGCEKEVPVRVERSDLGITATFPGQPRFVVYPEESPFGVIQWNSLAYLVPGRMDETFQAEVGSIPPGTSGGTTSVEVLDTFQEKVLDFKFGKVTRTDLPSEKGNGFRYSAQNPAKGFIRGMVILKRGRIYHAQVVVKEAEDPRATAFLESFQVTV